MKTYEKIGLNYMQMIKTACRSFSPVSGLIAIRKAVKVLLFPVPQRLLQFQTADSKET